MCIIGKVSLKTKILVLIIGLILLITLLLTTIYSFMEYGSTEEEIGEKALQTAKVVSYMPAIVEAFEEANPEEIIQPIALTVTEFTGAEYVVVGNVDSIRYAHPDSEKIGDKMVGGDNDPALIHGESYISKATGSLGPALRGKSPIIDENGEVIGIVSVGFMIEDIRSIVFQRLLEIMGASFLVLVLGIFGGIMLTKSIRKDTMGLEPYEIASLYRERNAILSSVHEGIIAIDQHQKIRVMNDSAECLVGLENKEGLAIEQIFPNIDKLIHTKTGVKNEELIVNDRNIIINVTPIMKDDRSAGAVISFRDKTELNEMIHTLSEVRKYSEDLRAQTHEYTNKLYVLSGLLQLGKYDEAIELIQEEANVTKNQNRILFEQIKDPTVQAVLLGKLGTASEVKINLIIDSNSYLDKVPNYISASQLITILGNLLDNAIEAVKDNANGRIVFSATDLGNDIIFEIADNGEGIPVNTDQMFERGFSTKGTEGRGYGLAIVSKTLADLNGQIEAHNQPTGGAVFSVFIPKIN